MPESEQVVRNDYDPDLNGWRTASWTPFRDNDRISGFAYGKINGNDRYVAVASTGIIGWSENGDNWQPASVKDENGYPFTPWNLNAVAFGNGMFVAVGNSGRFFWSNNGINWTTTETPVSGFGTENIFGIVFGAGLFVAVGANANISFSTNGMDWTGCRDGAFGTSQLNDISFAEHLGRFYIVGNDGKRGFSDNPASGNWNFRGPGSPPHPDAPFGTNNIRKVAIGRYRNDIGIGIVFNEWGGKRTAIATLTDFSGFDADIDDVRLQNNEINDITWGGSYFVIGGSTSMIGHWHSANPEDFSKRIWSAQPFQEFDRWAITAIEALNGRFFIGNFGGKIGYSK